MAAATRSTAGLRCQPAAIGRVGWPEREVCLAIGPMLCKFMSGREMKQGGKHMFIPSFGICKDGRS
jgi:hypothetical protein